jgi:hypothetical protein
MPSYLNYATTGYSSFNYNLNQEWYPDWQFTDIAPPTSAVEPLPAFSRDDVTVRWSGADPGGSGVETYDVQYRIGPAGIWQDWQLGTWSQSATFGKLPGKTVYFRCRATDKAGQKEAWPAGDGDTHTTFYNWKITGRATDNRLVPLSGVTVTTTQQVLEIKPSGEDGIYSAYFDGYDFAFQIDLLKAGYGAPATTEFLSANDGNLDVLMPPTDNILADPNFEAASFSSENWQADGLFMPALTTDQRHTGDQGVSFGRHFDLETIAHFDADVQFNPETSPRQDATGRFHAVWHIYNPTGGRTIYYASGDRDGNWSEPIAPVPFNSNVSELHWDVTADGRVHIIWKDYKGTYDMIYHTWRDDTGWHDPEIVYNIGWVEFYDFRLDSQGGGHLLWHLRSSGLEDFFYSYVNPSGAWSAPDRLFAEDYHDALKVVLDHDDGVHLLWGARGSDFYHNYRLPDGSWSALEKIVPSESYNWYGDLIIDDNNGLHLVWGNVSSGKISHSKRQADGSWSPATILSAGTNPERESVKTMPGPGGTLFIVWNGNDYSCRKLFQAHISDSGVWTGTDELNPGSECISDFWLRRYNQQIILLAEQKTYEEHHFCQLSLVSGDINSAGECTFLPTAIYGHYYPHPLVGLDGLSHVFWRKAGTDGIMELLHSRSLVNETAGESRLQQTVTIPAEMLHPTLSFAYWQGFNAGDEDLALKVSINDGLQTTQVFSGTQTAGWSYQWVDLEPWTGQEITVIFTLQQKVGAVAAWAYLDEAFLGSAYPDTWATIEGRSFVAPGDTLDLILHYGNKSSAAAEGSRLTATLPDELAITTAIPAPTTQTGQLLVWDLGTLTVEEGLGTITITTLVSPTLTEEISLPVSVDLDTDTPELNMANNSHQIMVVVSRKVFLPVVLR